MELSRLRPIYQHDGPFATVYLEGRSPGEDAAAQMRLRWRGLRDRLESAGGHANSLDAIEQELVGGTVGEQQTDGRVLVAADGAIVLDEAWDAAVGAGDDAHWGELPELGAYVREAARSVRELVVIADQQGAQVRQEVIAEQHQPTEVGSDVVQGSAIEGVHKPRGQDMAHKQIQRRADEAVQRNAKDIVEHVRGISSTFRPGVLVLAGEVQARTAIRDELPSPLAEIVSETDRGDRNPGASEEALADELLRIAGEARTGGASARTEQLRAGLAHGQATQGADAVAQAAEMGAVDTLLFEPDVPAFREAMLLKSCAETDSTFALVAEETVLTDGVGALLRFSITG